jgi:hypothetical protein
VVPPDSFNSDGSESKEDPHDELAKRHVLKPWDKIRYLWRGELKLMARSFNALISAASSPQLEPHEPFLHVSAGTLAVAVTGGRGDVTATGLTALGHAKGPEAGPGEWGMLELFGSQLCIGEELWCCLLGDAFHHHLRFPCLLKKWNGSGLVVAVVSMLWLCPAVVQRLVHCHSPFFVRRCFCRRAFAASAFAQCPSP